MSDALERPTIRCQYWLVDGPTVCPNWDGTVCTYQEQVTTETGGTVTVRADAYPLCNFIGTDITCSQYAGEPEGLNRCVLPDPSTNLGKSPSCGAWIKIPAVSYDDDGNLVLTGSFDFSDITGYNAGQCDEDGTQTTCAAYNPPHLGFGLRPIPEKCTVSGVAPSTTKLPLKYTIRNYAAALGKCKWWDGELDFTIELDQYNNPSVVAPIFKCTSDKPRVQEYSKFKTDDDYKYQRPPCNGAMLECPYYTGNVVTSEGKRSYLSDLYIRTGDKVLAETILELRYNLKRESWSKEKYDVSFLEPEIYTWEGTRPQTQYDTDGSIIDWSISSFKVYIEDFECLKISKTGCSLTKGNPSDNNKPDYPHLLRELKDLYLDPIIRSKFIRYKEIKTDPDTGQEVISWIRDENITEVASTDHKYTLLVGDTFFSANKVFAINFSDPDMKLPSPLDVLFDYKGVGDYRRHVFSNKQKSYDERVQEFEDFHEQLDCYLNFILNNYSDKVFYSEWDDNGAFYIKARTFFGENKIMVFDSGPDYWGADAMMIKKVFVGGLLCQTDFYADGPSEVDTWYDYERFGLNTALFSTKIKFEFQALSDVDYSSIASPDHAYMDATVTRPSDPISGNTLEFSGFKTYKITAISDYEAGPCEMTLLGNTGIIMLDLDDVSDSNVDRVMQRVISDWEIEGDIILRGIDYEGNPVEIEMQVKEKCSDWMEDNQVLLEPKQADKYRRVWEPKIAIEKVYTYERRSFGELPEGEYTEVPDPEGKFITRYTGEFTRLGINKWEWTSLPNGPLNAAIVYRGSKSGRLVGQVKSDLIAWIKQPFCSDVEMFYNWTAVYDVAYLYPTHYCFVDQIQMDKIEEKRHKRSRAPLCGDHYFGVFSTVPSWMWYPYDSCILENAYYNIFTKQFIIADGEKSYVDSGTGVITGEESSGHGTHDYRMMGPAYSFGEIRDVFATIWACSCDWMYQNVIQAADPYFSGACRIRTGIDSEQMYYITRNGGTAPTFGNPYRDYVRSIRTNRSVYFYTVSETGDIGVDKKWVPIEEGYWTRSFSAEYVDDYPFTNTISTSDNVQMYYNQMAVLKAVVIDGSYTVEEEMITKDQAGQQGDNISWQDAYNGVPIDPAELARFDFDTVFRAHGSTAYIAWPDAKVKYEIGEQTPKQLYPYYTYKHETYNGQPGTVQCAWREPWLKIERKNHSSLAQALENLNEDYDPNAVDDAGEQVFPLCQLSDTYTRRTLTCVELYHPNYTYDYKTEEHRRCPEEGEHILHFYPPSEPEPGFTDKPLYFLLSMDSGTYIVLDINCTLVTDPAVISGEEQEIFSVISNSELADHIRSYEITTTNNWLSGKTAVMDLDDSRQEDEGYIPPDQSLIPSATFMLFETDVSPFQSEEAAEVYFGPDGEDQVVRITDGVEFVDYYYVRGLYSEIYLDKATSLPKESKPLQNFNFKVSEAPIADNPTNPNANLQANVLTPGTTSFGCAWLEESGSGQVDFSFLLDAAEPYVTLDRVEVKYKFGFDRVADTDAQGNPTTTSGYNVYNIPSVTISNGTGSEIFLTGSEKTYKAFTPAEDADEDIAEIRRVYNLNQYTPEYMSERYKSFKVVFDYSTEFDGWLESRDEYLQDNPDLSIEDELKLTEYYYGSNKGVFIYTIEIFTSHYTEFHELIDTKERKFNVSVGNYGTVPIHGDGGSSLLHPIPNEPTIYQYDTRAGLFGKWITGEYNSVSKQRSRLCGPMKEDLEVFNSDLSEMENKQVEIYNENIQRSEGICLYESFAHEIFKEQLEVAGVVNIPRWECTLENNSNATLKRVPAVDPYWPKGHEYFHNYAEDAVKWEWNCGGAKFRWKMLFAYGFREVGSEDPDVQYATDIFDTYSYGTSRVYAHWYGDDADTNYGA